MPNLRNQTSNAKPSVVKVKSTIQQGSRTLESTGSGFIVKKEGILISNNHVVINDDPIGTKVIFNDGIEKQCTEIIYRDNQHDYIIFRIEQNDYQELLLGDYNDVEEGDEIYFCGYPLKSNHYTVHGGNVSSKFEENEIKIIQIDGSVNSGNSGGPLFNMDEKVVGIVSQKAGGIDDKLMGISNLVKSAPTVMSIGYQLKNGQTINVDPTKSLAEVIQIIHDYTSVGIGYAFSIEYAKKKLVELNLN